jgi:hypothetical protein
MLFFGGLVFLIVGIVMVFRVFRNSRRPRIDGATVLEVTQDFYVYKGKPSGTRRLPHARIEYFYDGHKTQSKILLKSKAKPGDGIQLSVNPKKPGEVEEYYPAKEIMVSLLIFAIGAGIMIGCLALSDYLERN